LATAAPPRITVLANASKWVRAPEGGVLRTTRRIGDAVSQGEVIGAVVNPYDDTSVEVRSPRRGIIIGRTTLPIVNMGDALFHVAWSEEIGGKPSREPVREAIAEPVMDEDEII
jgi:predicted deacylase